MTILAPQKNLIVRLISWLKKPLIYKFKSIVMKILFIFYKSLFPILKVLKLLLFNNRLIRKITFDLATPNTFLLSNGSQEKFIVASGDKGIGQSVFVDRDPFDFQKMITVIDFLGIQHKRSLLVEIGANIGTICIPAIKRNYFQRAIAIEPDPQNYSLLLANIAINDLGAKITTHNIALGEKDDEILFFELSENNYGDHRIRKYSKEGFLGESKRKVIEIKSTTLDKIISELDPTEVLIWLDVQGFEGYVLYGSSNALSKKPPICLEFWPYGMERSGCYLHLKDALINNGYSFFYNLEKTESPIQLTQQTLDNLYNELGINGDYTDLLVY